MFLSPEEFAAVKEAASYVTPPVGVYRFKVSKIIGDTTDTPQGSRKIVRFVGTNADTGNPLYHDRMVMKDGQVLGYSVEGLVRDLTALGLSIDGLGAAIAKTPDLPVVTLSVSESPGTNGKVNVNRALSTCADQTVKVAPKPADEAPF